MARPRGSRFRRDRSTPFFRGRASPRLGPPPPRRQIPSSKRPPRLLTPPPCRHQITLHHYGHLQRNKASLASHHCEAIESLDRAALALRLRHVLDQAPHPPRLRSVLIQINLGREPQKSGVDPDHADALVALARDLALPLTGVMAIPPRHQPPVPHFRWLRHFADRHHLPDVHMGMSDDFPLAIQAGATAIRIGRLLFDHQP